MAEKYILKDLLEELEDSNKLATGLKLIHQAEDTMKQGEDNSVERAFVALDLISEAKNLARVIHTACIILSSVSQYYLSSHQDKLHGAA